MFVRLLYSSGELFEFSSLVKDVIYGTDNYLWAPHAKRKLKDLIFTSVMKRPDVFPTRTAELAVQCLVIIACYDDRALRRQRLDKVRLHTIEVLIFVYKH